MNYNVVERETIIFTQLSLYYELIFDNPYGFRPKYLTEYAALELSDRIKTQMHKKVPMNIFIDLSKAFDTIDNTIVLDKLVFRIQFYCYQNVI